ncbi:EndoU nuclease-like protein [Prosthecobacter fusiformis]|uniref:EndoU nuclease-like protein n=1 Tax=Prosthecobacter fusiformis TaxID=48464 RepID=A0A4R7RJT9_9BACT
MAGQQLRRWREEEGRALSVPGVMPPAVLRPEQDGQLRPVVPGVPAAGGMGGAGAAAAPTQPAWMREDEGTARPRLAPAPALGDYEREWQGMRPVVQNPWHTMDEAEVRQLLPAEPALGDLMNPPGPGVQIVDAVDRPSPEVRRARKLAEHGFTEWKSPAPFHPNLLPRAPGEQAGQGDAAERWLEGESANSAVRRLFERRPPMPGENAFLQLMPSILPKGERVEGSWQGDPLRELPNLPREGVDGYVKLMHDSGPVAEMGEEGKAAGFGAGLSLPPLNPGAKGEVAQGPGGPLLPGGAPSPALPPVTAPPAPTVRPPLWKQRTTRGELGEVVDRFANGQWLVNLGEGDAQRQAVFHDRQVAGMTGMSRPELEAFMDQQDLRVPDEPVPTGDVPLGRLLTQPESLGRVTGRAVDQVQRLLPEALTGDVAVFPDVQHYLDAGGTWTPEMSAGLASGQPFMDAATGRRVILADGVHPRAGESARAALARTVREAATGGGRLDRLLGPHELETRRFDNLVKHIRKDELEAITADPAFAHLAGDSRGLGLEWLSRIAQQRPELLYQRSLPRQMVQVMRDAADLSGGRLPGEAAPPTDADVPQGAMIQDVNGMQLRLASATAGGGGVQVEKEAAEPADDTEFRNKAVHSALEGVMSGKSSFEALNEWRAQFPKSDEMGSQIFLDAYQSISRVVSPAYDMIQEFMDATERKMTGKAEPSDEAFLTAGADWLIDEVNEKDRPLILAALRAEAEKRGLINAEKKGTGYVRGATQMLHGAGQVMAPWTVGKSTEANLFWQQMGESIFRFSKGMITDRDGYEKRLMHVPESGDTRYSGGPILTLQDAIDFVNEKALEEPLTGSIQSNSFAHGYMPPPDMRRTISPDANATRLIQEAKSRALKALQIKAEIENLGNKTDPIPNVFASTLGTSGVAMGMTVATRGMALPFLIAGYKNIEFNELSLKYPEMSREDRAQIAWISGTVQAAADRLGASMLTKLPGIKSLLTKQITKQLISSTLGRLAAVNVGENLVEGVQDIITPALMQALKSDVPGYDWEAEKRAFWNGRADVAIGMLPLTLLGLGQASLQDVNGAQELLTQDDVLASAGITEADRKAIVEKAQSGDGEAAQTALQQAWGRRDPAIAAEHQKRISDQEARVDQVFTEAMRRGVMPEITPGEDGRFMVTDSAGNEASFATRQEALAAAITQMTDPQRAEVEGMLEGTKNLEPANPSPASGSVEPGGLLVAEPSLSEVHDEAAAQGLVPPIREEDGKFIVTDHEGTPAVFTDREDATKAAFAFMTPEQREKVRAMVEEKAKQSSWVLPQNHMHSRVSVQENPHINISNVKPQADKSAQIQAGRNDSPQPTSSTDSIPEVPPDEPPNVGPSIDFDHIIGAEINPKGKATGGHSLVNGDVRIIPGTEGPPNASGIYEAGVEMKHPSKSETWIAKTSNGGRNTMFPKNWSAGQIQAEVEAAWNSPSKIINGQRWQAVSPSGAKIEGFINPKRITAYPKY